MNRIKICIVPQAVKSLKGGVYNYCVDSADLLEKSETINATLLPKNISVRKLPIIGKEVFSNKDLTSYIKNSDADIFHINGFAILSAIQTMLICIRSNKQIVYSPHFHPFKHLRRPLLGKWFFSFIIRPFLKKVDGIITINDTDTSFFKRFHQNVFKIPHYLKPLKTDTKIVKRIPNRILFVGRNESNKGVEYIEKIPFNYELVCVIDKPINRANTIYYSNINRKELSALYQSASLVVVPSRYEAFSYVAQEALSCGTPVLMSNHVEIATYLKNVKGSYVFDYGDVNGFLRTIEIAIGGDVDVEKIYQLFSSDTILHKYEQAYCSILNPKCK